MKIYSKPTEVFYQKHCIDKSVEMNSILIGPTYFENIGLNKVPLRKEKQV